MPWSSTQGPVRGRSFFPYPVCYGVRTSLGSKKGKDGGFRAPPESTVCLLQQHGCGEDPKPVILSHQSYTK